MIKVYTKNDCPQCNALKSLLEELEIPYKPINIDEDNDAKEFVVSEGHRSVPVVYVGGVPFPGGANRLLKIPKDRILPMVEDYIGTKD
jgi:glutaredoxin-like protein NrdH